MKPQETLYGVYSSRDASLILYPHLSDAIADAKIRAEKYSGHIFYVLKSITGFCTAPPEVQELQFRDAPDNGTSTITNLIKESRRENS